MLAQSGDRQRSGKRRLREGKRGRQRTGVAPAGAGWGVSCSGTSNFLFCKKKVTKENHSNLWFKDPWRGEGKCKFGGADLAELVRWVTLLSVQGSLVPLAPLPLTAVRVGVGALVVFGEYQIAPIAARSTAMGRWRLTPPGYGGTCLPAGRSVRGSDRPPACHSTLRTPQGEGFGGWR